MDEVEVGGELYPDREGEGEGSDRLEGRTELDHVVRDYGVTDYVGAGEVELDSGDAGGFADALGDEEGEKG